MSVVVLLLLIAATILLLIAAAGVTARRVQLGWLGLALFVVAYTISVWPA